MCLFIIDWQGTGSLWWKYRTQFAIWPSSWRNGITLCFYFFDHSPTYPTVLVGTITKYLTKSKYLPYNVFKRIIRESVIGNPLYIGSTACELSLWIGVAKCVEFKNHPHSLFSISGHHIGHTCGLVDNPTAHVIVIFTAVFTGTSDHPCWLHSHYNVTGIVFRNTKMTVVPCIEIIFERCWELDKR